MKIYLVVQTYHQLVVGTFNKSLTCLGVILRSFHASIRDVLLWRLLTMHVISVCHISCSTVQYCNYFLCKSPWRWPIFSLDGAVTYKIVLSAKSRTSDSIYSFLHVEQILSQVPNTGPHGVCDWAFSCLDVSPSTATASFLWPWKLCV